MRILTEKDGKANQACGHLWVRLVRSLKEEREMGKKSWGIRVSQRMASRICRRTRIEVRFYICYPMFNLHVTAICLQAFLATPDFVLSPSQSHVSIKQCCPLSFNFMSYSAFPTVYKLLLGFPQSISAHLHGQKQLITPCRHELIINLRRKYGPEVVVMNIRVFLCNCFHQFFINNLNVLLLHINALNLYEFHSPGILLHLDAIHHSRICSMTAHSSQSLPKQRSTHPQRQHLPLLPHPARPPHKPASLRSPGQAE